jgi:putative transposase
MFVRPSQAKVQAGGQVKRSCGWVKINRAGYYRFRQPVAVDTEELALRSLIQKIAVEWPAYGYRRITRELRDQYGYRVNYKRVLRMMREDNLLCLRRQAFWLPTTNSAHHWPVFANVAAEMKGKLKGIDQLWVADITYIRLELEYVYLAVAGLLLAPRGGLGVGWDAGSRTGLGCVAHGGDAAAAWSWSGASFRSRRAICLCRLS